ncbi:hypothetical protein HCN44_004309 [Aphidius gifuensis]|uniref:Large ribosomal subunit protein uL29m n=1 Tax=Aphidius gifuensis TaxID=684658 RepID=A0A834Y0C8_APHGI|nr:hypothetical protein HCN44_004309 [Aphidius gifuensis]
MNRLTGSITSLTKLLTNLTVSSSLVINNTTKCVVPRICMSQVSCISTTPKNNDLMEFFDAEKYWGAKVVKVGRSWLKDELRLKSNEDLHKLWYILLKEKNMLLTMEHACKEAFEYFPSPERLDKVEESMENLETVVRERNIAYHQLETGESGERKARIHVMPQFMNTSWQKRHIFRFGGRAVAKFRRRYHEKLFLEKRKARQREQNAVKLILQQNKDVDMDAIKEKYPSVDLERLKHTKYAQGHFIRHFK